MALCDAMPAPTGRRHAPKSVALSRERLVRDLHRRLQRPKYRGNVAALARVLGVTRQYLAEVLNGTLAPGKKILDAVGYESITVFRPIRKEKP